MKYFSLALFCLLLVISCSDNNTDSNDSKKEIWPLAVGNKWTYTIFSYHSSNIDSIEYNGTVEYYIPYSKISDGVEWFAFAEFGETLNFYFTNKSDGLWGTEYLNDTSDFNPKNTLLAYKYPTYVGEYNPKDSSGIKTVSINDLLNTPAGNFNCIKYIQAKDETSSIYLAPGIGLVKTEQITHIDTIAKDTSWVGQILISYELKKK